MDMIMFPFIKIYHLVHYIFMIPTKLFKKTEDKIIEIADQTQMNVNKDEIASNENDLVTGENKEMMTPYFSYRYTIINEKGRKKTATFEAENADRAKEFLISEGYNVVDIKPRSKLDIDIGSAKIKTSELAFSLTQLSTYLKAGLPLIDSVRLIAKQSTNAATKKAFERVVYDLLKGESFSKAMQRQQEKFPKLLINMVETAEMTGDLTTILDDMADYYADMNKLKKEMISAMTYPVVVFVIAIGVVIFMMMKIVPSFVLMFEEQEATLPLITKVVIKISNFLKGNFLWIFIVLIITLGVCIYLYKNISSFRKTVQTAAMRTPVLGKIIIYNEVTNFTKTFASLLNHGVFITDSMEILSRITNNEIYKGIIKKTIINLGKGESISVAFKGEWAFPIIAYEMIVTGEKTGQLGLMMERVSNHFQVLHKSLVDQMKSLIEPILIATLAVMVGVILLSVVVPMFDIYGQIK